MTTKTIDEVLASIEAAASHPTLRTEVAEIGQVIHQGDVYLHRVADDHPRGKMLGTRQIAIGTTTGARHVVEGDVAVYEGKELPPWFIASFPKDDVLGPVVVAGSETILTHPEHAHSVLCGVYQVTYQYDWETRQRVAD